jgi:hypothetical protein
MSLNEGLLGRLQDAVRSDEELAWAGRFFNARILLGSGERRFLLHFRDGELIAVLPDPPVVEPWQFAVKAPEETWDRFLEDPPPPMFHDIWAATWMGHMTLEGDMKVFMQHHYALWRTLKLMRELEHTTVA